jgi:hypothetical protein
MSTVKKDTPYGAIVYQRVTARNLRATTPWGISYRIKRINGKWYFDTICVTSTSDWRAACSDATRILVKRYERSNLV